MTTYAALLRAVNVGGTGKLPMTELRALCEAAGLANVRTYIQSGNALFESRLSASSVKKKLELALEEHMGKSVRVLVRSASELADIVQRSPFPEAPPNRVLILFMDDAPPKNALAQLVIPGREQVVLSGRELFIHFPEGMGQSKLKLPFSKIATARNMSTVSKLAALAREAR